MVSSTKGINQALIIVSNTPLEIISHGFFIGDMLDSCTYNHLILCCQDPLAKCAAYSVKHANQSSNIWFLFQLFLVPILSKVVVTKIGPSTYVNSLTSYAFHTCAIAFDKARE